MKPYYHLREKGREREGRRREGERGRDRKIK
jgi:hypothetical protein